jgi:NMT1/THI5 like
MSKNWRMLTGLLFLGSVGTLHAHPLDLPGIVYIDGLPCNSACQSYMAWSRQKKSSAAEQPAPEQPARRSSYSAVRRATTMQSSKPRASARTAKQAVPMPPAKVAGPQSAGNAAVASETARANVAASPPSGGEAAISAARTVQEQVAAATALAEHATIASAAPVPQPEASNAEISARTEAVQPSDTEQTASAPTSNTDNLVAVLMARPEIKSVSDLTGKDVAMADRQSASSASIRTAIAAAGAVEVQLNEGHAKTIDRLIAGEVPAAILTLVSPEAAEWFPDIAGYRIFRIPLSPGPLKARL